MTRSGRFWLESQQYEHAQTTARWTDGQAAMVRLNSWFPSVEAVHEAFIDGLISLTDMEELVFKAVELQDD